MDQLTENIANAAQTLQYITEEARRRQDEQIRDASTSPAQASALRLIQQKAWIDAHWPIAWPNWPPGLWAKIVALWQKLIRRSLQWYISPIVAQQNEFNQAALSAARALSSEVASLRATYLKDRAAQQARLDALAAQIAVLLQMLQTRDS